MSFHPMYIRPTEKPHAQYAIPILMTFGTHTHTRLTALFPGLPGWAGTRKVKPIWIETVSGRGISWAYASLQLTPDR